METEKDRRVHQRLPLKLNVLCHKVGISSGAVYKGGTVNVSPGGMLLEVNRGGLSEGELLSIEMSVPPTKGLLEYGGRFSSYARVIRIDKRRTARTAGPGGAIESIALEFCGAPKLQV